MAIEDRLYGEDQDVSAPRPRFAEPRLIAIVGPYGSGKSTLVEAILARTDTAPEAEATPGKAPAMSVAARFVPATFMRDRYVFVDCPGSVEFRCEADGVLAAADLAVVVCEADPRKLPALQMILKDLEERGIPRVLFLNKIDRLEARVRETLETLQSASRTPLVLRQIPIWRDGIATGFIDLALERAFVYREHAASRVMPIPDEARAREVEARFEMLERVADYDDALMEELLSDIEPPRDRVFDDLAREMREGLICPVFLGAAQRGNGVFRLLKALRHESPGVAETRTRLGLGSDQKTVVQVMKTLHSSHIGKLSLARVLSGGVSEAQPLQTCDGRAVKPAGLYDLVGEEAVKRGPAGPGEVVALARLDGVATGATLGSRGGRVFSLVDLAVPPPVLAFAVAPAERKDEVKLTAALGKLAEEDNGLSIEADAVTGETRLCGQGEIHLRTALERLAVKFGLAVSQRPPRVPYRETIRSPARAHGRHKKQSGGHGQFGDVTLELVPLPRGEGFRFASRIAGGVVPKAFIPAIEAGVRDSLGEGPLGFPVTDLAVTLVDGAAHAVDSSEQAFRAAAHLAMREGLAAAGPLLLEPMLAMALHCPSEATARINAVLAARRGQITGFEPRAGWPGWDCITALMPEAEIRDLIVEIRSATAGVGDFRAKFDHLAPLEGRLAEEVVDRRRRDAA